MKITFGWIWFLPVLFALAVVHDCAAQTRLSLQDAVAEALRSRPALAAAAQQVSAAQGLQAQAGMIENPTFQFENQNLHPGMTYGTDVDTYAYLTQPLDILGKRKQRIQVAQDEVASAQADYELDRRRLAHSVAQAYWAARGAQENRDLLDATVANFQKIVDYQSAQLRVGAISEQDFLRIQLEGERLKISQNLAVIEATRTRVELERAMGRTEFRDLVLTEPLDGNQTARTPAGIQQVLAQRVEMRVANAALASAEAKEKLEDVVARPDLSVEAGLKRTQLVDTSVGTNTALAGLQITLPVSNRNQGNRAAANAEVLRQRQLLAETQVGVLADYYGAVQDYQLRSQEVSQTLVPLRDHANEIAQIAENVYAQTGLDLLRLIDAERAQIDAQVAYVQGMVEYQQSIVNLEAAEGVAP
jgi:outer membrane protein, heavy metal efflux system